VNSCGAPAAMRRGSEEKLRGGEALDNLHGSAAKRTSPQRVNGPRWRGGAGCWRMGLLEQARTEWKEFRSPPGVLASFERRGGFSRQNIRQGDTDGRLPELYRQQSWCRSVDADPQKKLNDISAHLSTVFRGLYRNRNIVLHGGETGAVGLRSSLRNAAPLVGAGMDRIAHAWFVEGLEPVQIAARASVRLATVGAADAPDIVDLLI
jgi:hypothetical protein